MSAADRWSALRDAPAWQDGYAVGATGVRTAFGEIRSAIDSAGHQHLLMPVRPGSRVEEDRSGDGVQIRGTVLVDEAGHSHDLADLVCLKPHLSSAFQRMVEEVLLAMPSDLSRPDRAAGQVLSRWRELFALLPRGPLAPSQQLGLFGELLVMRELQLEGLAADAWWTGADRHRHDFCTGAADIEVKTSGSADSLKVTIHGLGQLEPPPSGPLVLAFLRLETAGADGMCLPDLVREVTEAAADKAKLAILLAKAGYSAEHEGHYMDTRLRTVARRWFRVDAGFPRLSADSFAPGHPHPGVSAISYTADLAHAVAFEVPDWRPFLGVATP